MSPRHHPTDALLFDYASGTLTAGSRLVIASHLGACRLCAESVAMAEMVGGLLLDDLPGADLNPDALAHVLARIDRPGRPAVPPLSRPDDWIEVPAEVLRALAGRGRRWAPGAWVSPVTKGPGKARGYLLGMAAGRGVPRHTHTGQEMTCVLKGSFIDDGVIYGPGDFTEHDGSVKHAPQATDDGDCVCLMAVSSPLSPADWVGRIVLPILGF